MLPFAVTVELLTAGQQLSLPIIICIMQYNQNELTLMMMFLGLKIKMTEIFYIICFIDRSKYIEQLITLLNILLQLAVLVDYLFLIALKSSSRSVF